MHSEEPKPSIRASNRCPACAYPLDGLPGIDESAYGPCHRDVSCPECGLRMPMGSRCVVGASMLHAVDPSTRPWGGNVALVALGLLGVGQLVVVALSVLRTGAFVPQVQGALLVGFAGVAIGFIMTLRRHMRVRSLESDGALGGADVRLLFEPGALRVFTSAPGSAAESCAASDVQRITAATVWRFFPKPHAPGIMAMHIQVPAQLRMDRRPGSVVNGYFYVPRGALPTDLARAFTATLRTQPGTGADLPAPRTLPTPSAPPACPLCGASLATAAHAAGNWSEPLAGPVACPKCTFQAPGGAYVLGGAGQATGLLSRRQRRLLIASVAVSVVAAAGLGGLLWSFALGTVTTMLAMQLFVVLALLGMPVVLARVARDFTAPRPAGRFQPCDVTWVVQPGELRIIERRGRRRVGVRRIAAAGISRLEFGVIDFEGQNFARPDALIARGTAPELGLLGERSIALAVYAGVDRDQLAADVTRTLKKGPREAET